MKLCPIPAVCNKHSGEEHSVEIDICALVVSLSMTPTVLAHELVQLNVIRVLPPLLPLVRVLLGHRDITNRGIKPHVNNLVLELFVLVGVADRWHSDTPLEVTSNRAGLESRAEHTWLNDLTLVGYNNVACPLCLDTGSLQPLLEFWLDQVQAEARVGGGANRDLVALIPLAAGVLELCGRGECESTVVTLVTTRIVVTTVGADSLHEAVRKEELVVLAVCLVRRLQLEVTVLVDVLVDVLSNLGLRRARCASPLVKADLKPPVISECVCG